MANYATLKAAIQAAIYENGNNEITGIALQQSLLSMISSLGDGFQFMGIATPTTNPGTPDENVFYLASTAGTYTNFGGLALADGEIAILKYDGAWTKDVSGAASEKKLNSLPRIVDRFTLIGNGNNYIYKDLYNIVPGRKYRVYIPTIYNDNTGTDGQSYLFGIVCYDSNNVAHTIVLTQRNVTTYQQGFVNYIPSKFDFEIDPTWVGGYIRIGCRSNIGQNPTFFVVDITDGVLLNTKTNFSFGPEESYYGLNLYSSLAALTPSLTGTHAKYYFEIEKSARVKIKNSSDFKISAYWKTIPYAPTQYLLTDDGEYFFVSPGILVIAIYKTDLSSISDAERLSMINSISINIRYVGNGENESLCKGLFVKTKDEFMPLAENAYMSANKAYPDPQFDNNYITYIIPNDDVKYIKAHISGSGVHGGIIFWKTPVSNINGRIAQIPHTIIGSEDVFCGIPEGTRFITITSGIEDFDFSVYYNSLPSVNDNVFLDKVINSDTSNGELISSSFDNLRVVTKSICSFPHAGLTIKMRLPFNIRAFLWFSSAGSAVGINRTTTWLMDGDSYVFPSNACMFRIVFKNVPEGSLLPADYIQNCINKGMIAVLYDKDEAGILERTKSMDVRFGALKRNLTGLNDDMDSMFVFGHISDLHGDSNRLLNFMEYMNAKSVDAVINSGDSVMYRAVDKTDFCQTISAKYPSIPYIFCIGNHESYPTGQTTLFADNIQNLVSPNQYLKDSSTPADNCYYYRDFESKKIRIIALNYYNNGIYAGSIGQEQINWFISTLQTVPTGYGVIVTLHSPEDKVIANPPYDIFRQKTRVVEYQENGFYVGNRPIMQIVDAFIGRNSLSTSYVDNDSTVNVNCDFSNIDNTIEFICYVVGHRHEDWIGYYEHATHKQLSLGITAGIALYGYGSNSAWANQEDLPRGGKGVYQDAFNIYAINRMAKTVKVVRIGADLTFDFAERKYMEIPYSD